MNYQDYIKDDSDGVRAYINLKGLQMVRSFLAKNGGVVGAMKVTGLSKEPLQKLRDKGYCAPDAWERLFPFISKSKQSKTAA